MKKYDMNIVKFFLGISLALTLLIMVLWYLGKFAQIADSLGF